MLLRILNDCIPAFAVYQFDRVELQGSDNIWVTLRSYGSLAKFDPKTKKFTYYLLPFADRLGRIHPGSHGTLLGGGYPPKIEEDSTGTFWYAGLGLDTLTSFRPNGNVPTQLSASK
jgi:hypothetical protein